MTDPTPNPLSGRRLGTLRHLATHRSVSERTARNWASAGYLRLYKIKGVAGVLVDLDEADAALDALPPGTIRPTYGTFGGVPVVDLMTEVRR